MKNNRLERINSEVRKAVAEIIDRELRDPQITAMISVVDVETTPDLAYAKVFLSCYGEQDKVDVLNRIKGAGSFIRGKLSSKLKLRVTPHLDFYLDESADYGRKFDEILAGFKYTTNPNDNFGEEK